MALPAFLTPAVQAWADFYGNHQTVSVAVRFLHLAGILVGGGTALAVDRRCLNAARSGEPTRTAALADLAAAHRVVVPSLAVVVATGALMALSDTETFFASRLYWSKIGLVGLLLLNGLGLLAAERAAVRGSAGAWTRLGLVSAASLLLWLAILLAGVWLTVAA
jgi:hypothetical protein